MNQIEINKIVTTKIEKDYDEATESWKLVVNMGDEYGEDYIILDPSQMKELKEKISKLEI